MSIERAGSHMMQSVPKAANQHSAKRLGVGLRNSGSDLFGVRVDAGKLDVRLVSGTALASDAMAGALGCTEIDVAAQETCSLPPRLAELAKVRPEETCRPPSCSVHERRSFPKP